MVPFLLTWEDLKPVLSPTSPSCHPATSLARDFGSGRKAGRGGLAEAWQRLARARRPAQSSNLRHCSRSLWAEKLPPHIHHNPKYQAGVRDGCGRQPRESWHAPEARLARARALSEVAGAARSADPTHFPGQRPPGRSGLPGRRRGRAQGPGR